MMNDRLDPDEFRLQGRLKEAREHLDRLESLLHMCGCKELDAEFDEIREVIDQLWKGR